MAAIRKLKPKRPRKAGMGAHKGRRYEWKVARRLSMWLTGGHDKTQLIPTRGSGGWASRLRKQQGQAGDLAANGPHGETFRRWFTVECKHHRTVDWWELWTRPRSGRVASWWRKLQAESANVGTLPLLIFRANNRPEMVGISARYAMQLEPDLPQKPNWLLFPHLDLAVLPLTTFLDAAPEGYFLHAETLCPAE